MFCTRYKYAFLIIISCYKVTKMILKWFSIIIFYFTFLLPQNIQNSYAQNSYHLATLNLIPTGVSEV